MFHKHLLALALAGACFGGPVAAAETSREADRAAIRAHIDSVFRAYMSKDRAGVRATHHQNWRGFLSGSRTVIKGIDAYMEAAEVALSSPARITSYTMREVDIVFYGNVAVVNYVADLKADLGGRPVDDTLRVLDVYVQEGGHWNQAASNVARHPDALAAQRQQPAPLGPRDRERLLREREAVWRAWFSDDRPALEAVLPPELVAINAGEEPWVTRASALAGAQQFVAAGNKLLRLEFPQTEIQVYGDTAILYTKYLYEMESQGKRETYSGRGTEIFVRRDGRWVNTGWHLDSGK